MGMDVYSRNEEHYFRRNVWGWHALADIVTTLQPALTVDCIEWHTNSGDGLDEATSHALAKALQQDVDSGRVTAALDQRAEELSRLPRTVCRLCHGTGLRTDDIGKQYGYDRFRLDLEHGTTTGGCNGCAGRGTEDPWAWSYHVEVADVTEFAEFLAVGDGFRIY